MHNELKQLLINHPNSGYVRYHMPRYISLFDSVVKYYANGSRILDIGKSPFTDALISKFYFVDTLGFHPDDHFQNGNHFRFDLSNSREVNLWRKDLPQYDLIVFAEVIEHLYVSPNQVFSFLKTILKKDGILLLQTPNAVSLIKRLRMIFGYNPYELI